MSDDPNEATRHANRPISPAAERANRTPGSGYEARWLETAARQAPEIDQSEVEFFEELRRRRGRT